MPLCLLACLTTTVSYFLASGFANNAYDHGLVRSAAAIAERLRSDGHTISLDMPAAAADIFRHNNQDDMYYQVLTENGERIGGDITLPGPYKYLQTKEPVFRYSFAEGQKLRVARIRAKVPDFKQETVLVQVAESLNERDKLTHSIFLSIFLSQVGLIVLGAIAVSLGINRGLTPIATLCADLRRSGPGRLTPLDTVETPEELVPVVESINGLIARLNNHVKSQQRFVDSAAHQLRTPIAGVKTYLGLAKRYSHDEEMRTVLDKADIVTNRLTAISDKLLLLSRAESAVEDYQFEDVDAANLLDISLEQIRAEVNTKKIALEVEGPAKGIVLQGDKESLVDLLVVFLENAVRYTASGGTIKVSCGNSPFAFYVEDSGPGIPENEREHVFERFYRVLGSGADGSGLGLSIAREIARRHSIELKFTETASGVGTRACILFSQYQSAFRDA